MSSNIRVKITPTSLSTVKVEVKDTKAKVSTISYGSRTLKSLTDMDTTQLANNSVIVYNAATGKFETIPVSTFLSQISGTDSGRY
jgi:hypothetical protein